MKKILFIMMILLSIASQIPYNSSNSIVNNIAEDIPRIMNISGA